MLSKYLFLDFTFLFFRCEIKNTLKTLSVYRYMIGEILLTITKHRALYTITDIDRIKILRQIISAYEEF